MSDINILVLENEEKQNFLKKHGKKLLLAGGLAALGAGGAAIHKKKKENKSFSEKINAHIGRNIAGYGVGAFFAHRHLKHELDNMPFTSNRKERAKELGGAIGRSILSGFVPGAVSQILVNTAKK